MKPLVFSAGAGLLCSALAAQVPESTPMPAIETDGAAFLRESVELRGSFVGPNAMHEPESADGRPHAVYGAFDFTHQQPVSRALVLRGGLSWRRIDFGGTDAPIPGCLQSAAAVLGADVLLNHQFGLRIEVRPGVYSDFASVGWSDCDVPALLGCEYRYSENIRLFAGVRYASLSEYPLLPLIGAIFQFNEKFSLDLLFPDIKFEYRPSEYWEWNLGISFVSGNFRTHMHRLNEDDDALRDAVVTYFESRPTLGIVYRGFDGVDLFANTGVVMGRKFDYYDAGREVIIGGAPFLEIGLRARF